MTKRPTWDEIRYIFVFGDSYSSTGYDVNGAHPSETNPLGNPPYPGDTYSGGPTWVGYLATEYNQSPILAYDYAVPGATVQGLKWQVKEWFLPHAAQKPTWAPWTSDNSLFLIWIGINDMGIGYDPQQQLKMLFEAQDLVYDAGARNFVFFNVPPTDRSPAGNESASIRSRISEWNVALVEFVREFRNSHDDVDVAIYDASGLFNEVLDNPTKYGFRNGTSTGDPKKCVWQDMLHPTSAMHKVIAADVAKFLINEEKKSA